MIEPWAGPEPTVTSLLGNALGKTAGDEAASDLALMYAGKWHRWPPSSTLSDRLRVGPTLAQRAAEAPVRLREGELMLVRRSAVAISPVEPAILNRIRGTVTLCQVPHHPEKWLPIVSRAGWLPARLKSSWHWRRKRAAVCFTSHIHRAFCAERWPRSKTPR